MACCLCPRPGRGGPGVPGKPFQAQAIIANPVSYGHIHVAERLGVPLHIMFPQPWVPTMAFPHPLANMPYTDELKKTNYLSYKMVDLLMWQGTEGMVNAFRTDVLGLRKIRKGDGGRDILLDLAIPHAFMWSPHLVPKPKDWGKIYDVIGTVTLEGPGSSYTPTPELEAFLGYGDGPIFVGFGSMVLQDPKGVTKMIIEAAEQAQVRVLIQSNWSDMAGDIDVSDNIFFLGSCPHDWLMPRVSAVVHHGGAGTTAAGLLAGKPTFIVPFFGDQPFWGRAVLDAGVGVEPCPIKELATEKLRSAFEKLKSPELRKRAVELSDLMRQEDGADGAVSCFYRNLPVHPMRCDLNCGRAATLWSQKDKLRLCNECEFVVTSRPENSPKDIVEYTYVDYSARGPDSVFEGASSGVCAMAHAIGSGIKDVFVKPAQRYREEGAKGAVVGLMKGLGGLIISPLVGTMVFADHVATGVYNNSREENEKKRGSIIKGNNKFLTALGFKSRNVHIGSMSVDEMVEGTSPQSRQIAIQLTTEEKKRLESRFHALMEERNGVTAAQRSASGTPHNGSLPTMNICMMTTGTWEESVGQYVAIGQRLKAAGHCVRLATNAVHRDRVLNAGLLFYPLGGSTATITNFLEYIHQQAKEKARHRSRLMSFIRSQDSFSEMNDLRELVFSLWPACVEADSVTPGKAFRADAIIAHPNLFGQTIVAERLGVPLHCMSDTPSTRTQALPHLLSSNTDLQRPYRYTPTNAASFDVIDKLIWGGGATTNNLLSEWRVPHTYLWNSALLPKPQDWRNEITVTGCINTVEDNKDADFEQKLQLFVTKNSNAPTIYFGLQCDHWASPRGQELVRWLKNAARTASVRIILQQRNNSNVRGEISIDSVLEIDHNVPVKRILPYVKAAVHWGDLSTTSACLAAAKPACVVYRTSTQRLWGQALALSGVGVQPLEIDSLTPSDLVRIFKALLDPKLADCAQRLASSCSPSDALEAAVSAFYSNLPLAGMTCDLDPTRIARVYDLVHELKLSYEARLVAHQITRDGGSASDLKYKPLKYSRHHPPKFSLRQLDTERLRSSPVNGSPTKVVYTHDPASEEIMKSSSPQKRRGSLVRGQSMALDVVEMPKFWSSPEEQTKCMKEINAKYEQLLAERGSHGSP
ncbi:hypothetical protein L917_13169 [Phytophthora nicotianae]|uniref:Uncharacterized protein n=1 Tax=Phytophthora nicotianae TaxID=4792 RepID=W2KRI5_PHYNI|nr:hypothetical protein L917_13169 [Phytophthora nicotianae]